MSTELSNRIYQKNKNVESRKIRKKSCLITPKFTCLAFESCTLLLLTILIYFSTCFVRQVCVFVGLERNSQHLSIVLICFIKMESLNFFRFDLAMCSCQSE